MKPGVAGLPSRNGLRVLLLALGYLALALASRMLALPPGFASPVWPAAGLALGVLLVWGWRCWPGIWLGSFMFNVWQDYDANGTIGVAVAAGIASGAALQALLGTALVKRFLATPAPLAHTGDALRALLFAGPLACLVSSGIGVEILHWSGRLPDAGLAIQRLAWWAGDSIGVLLFAPLTYLALKKSRTTAPRRATAIAVPMLITGALVVIANIGFDRAEESAARQEVALRAIKVIEAADRGLLARVKSLGSIARLFDLQREVTPEEYRIFATPLLDTPGLLAVEWMPRVTQAQYRHFAPTRKITGVVEHPITEPGGSNEHMEYFPVKFVLPNAGKGTAPEFSHAQDPLQREAMIKARDSGRPAATAPVPLARTGALAVLVFYPVYRPGLEIAGSPKARNGDLQGYVAAIFDLRALIAGFKSETRAHALRFRLTDMTSGIPHLLGGTLYAGSTQPWTGDLNFGDRRWRLELGPTADYWQAKHSVTARTMLVGSLLVVFIICLWLLNAAARATVLSEEIRGRRAAERSLRRLNMTLESEVSRRTAALTETERHFRATFDMAAVGISHTAPDGRLLRVNAKACEITGYSREECLRLTFRNITHPDDREASNRRVKQLIRGEVASYTIEKRYVRKDATVVWARVTASVVRDDAGAVQYLVMIIEDISEIRAVNERREASERRYREMFEHNPMPMWTYDPASLAFTAVNEAAINHYGYTREEFLRMTLRSLRVPEDAALLERDLSSRPAGYVGAREVRLRKKDGTVINAEIISHEVVDNGQRRRLVLANDITERRRAEILLSGQKDVLERIAAGAPLAEPLEMLTSLITKDSPGMLGSIMLADPQNNCLRPGAMSSLPADFIKAIDGIAIGEGVGACGTAAFRREAVMMSDAPGDALWNDFRELALAHGLRACFSMPILDAQDEVLGTFAVYFREPRAPTLLERQLLETLTHTAAIAIVKKREKNALLESEERHRATFEHSALAINHVSTNGRFLRVNPSMCELTGYSESELLEMGPTDISHPDDQPPNKILKDQLLRGEIPSYSLEKRYRKKVGAVIWTNVTVSAVRDHSGATEYTIGILQDISRRKQAEAALQQQEELNRLLLENLTEGVVACDNEGRLVQFNRAARDWHGADPRDMPPALWAEHFDLCASDGKTHLRTEEIPLVRAFNGEHVRNAPMSIVRKGASPRFVIASGAPVHDAQGTRIGAVVAMHDVTERQETIRKLQLFNSIIEQTRSLVEPDAIMGVITRLLGSHLDASRCAYATVDADADRFTIPIDFTNNCASTAGDYRLDLFGAQAVSAMRNGQTLVMRDVDAEISSAEGADMFNAIGIKAIICCPLVKNGRLAAMMAVHQTSPRDWTAEEISIVEDVVERCWATIERERALLDLRKAADDLTVANAAVERERSSLAARVEARTAELTAINSELAQAKDAAEAASRAKSAFLATVSHEIRTPMNGVLGAMELLERAGLDAQRGPLLNAAQRSARSLLELLNDLLDMAKIEAGRIEILPASVSLEAIVAQVVSTHLPTAITKGIVLSTRFGPAFPPWLQADAMRLRQILGNLVSNAIKFTAHGGVEVMVESAPRRERKHRIRVSVRDTGTGIPAGVLKTLFTPFEQGSAEVAKKSGGTGLGLAISRGLAERMGGRIWLESESGVGTTAILELDLAAALAPQKESRPLAEKRMLGNWMPGNREVAGAGGAGVPRILVVDDHPINRLLMVRQINQLGLAADDACDGIDALAKLLRGEYAAVITDCEMPRMDGYALAVAIRQGEAKRKDIPVIACTAHALPEVGDKCRSSGMSEVLTKPINLDRLAQSLGKWLPVSGRVSIEGCQSGARSKSVALDRAQLSGMSGGTLSIELEIIEEFRIDHVKVVDDLSNAIRSGDHDRCAHLAHRGKGACMTLGANALARAFAQLEQHTRKRGDAAVLNQAMRNVKRETRRLEQELSTFSKQEKS